MKIKQSDIDEVKRKKRKGRDPNDRKYSRKLNKQLRQNKPTQHLYDVKNSDGSHLGTLVIM